MDDLINRNSNFKLNLTLIEGTVKTEYVSSVDTQWDGLDEWWNMRMALSMDYELKYLDN